MGRELLGEERPTSLRTRMMGSESVQTKNRQENRRRITHALPQERQLKITRDRKGLPSTKVEVIGANSARGGKRVTVVRSSEGRNDHAKGRGFSRPDKTSRWPTLNCKKSESCFKIMRELVFLGGPDHGRKGNGCKHDFGKSGSMENEKKKVF